MSRKSVFVDLTVPNMVREPCADGAGTKLVQRGVVRGNVEVEIDDDMIRRMAMRALKSKSGRAVVGSGMVKCVARKRRVES